MEAVKAGAARLAGTTERRIVATVLSELSRRRRRRVRKVFGDGHAAERIVRIILARRGRDTSATRRKAR
jgi:UDP-N-acetylglucosamine 2-epimerase